MKKSNLKSESFIILKNKKIIKNNPQYLNPYKQKICKNISQILSNYYSSYPDEINNLK